MVHPERDKWPMSVTSGLPPRRGTLGIDARDSARTPPAGGPAASLQARKTKRVNPTGLKRGTTLLVAPSLMNLHDKLPVSE